MGAPRIVAAGSAAALVAAVCVVLTATTALAAPPAYVQVAGSPFATGGNNPTAVAYSPVGGLVAAANGNGSFSVFTSAANGALTLGPNSPFPAGSNPRGVAFRPDGTLVAVANFTGNSIQTFPVAANGTVSAAADTEATGGNVAAVAFSPSGQFVAAAENSVGRLFVWSVNAAGAMTAVPGSPINSTSNISSLAWSANNAFVGVADNINNQVSVFSINAGTGQPTLAFGPVATPSTPTGVAINPAGTLLATSNNGSLSTFAMAASGALSGRQDFARAGQLRSVKFRPDGARLAAGGGATGLVYVDEVAANGVLTPVSGSPFNTFGSFNWEAAWSPNGTYVAVADGNTDEGHVAVLGPYRAPVAACSAADIRASQRFWEFGANAQIDFATSGTTATAGLSPGAFTAVEGSTTVSDTNGQLLFYSNGATIFDRNGNAMPNGSGLVGAASAVQTVAAFPAIGRSGVYFVVVTTTDYAVSLFGTLFYSEVDMNLNGGLGDVTAVKNMQLGAVNTASEALNAIPNSAGTGFWVLTQQAAADSLLAYAFNGTGPVSGTPVVSPLSDGGVGHTINVSPDLSQIVMESSGFVHVVDFDGLNGTGGERFFWAESGAGRYSADFSPSGSFVYTSSINVSPSLHRYLIAGQPDSAAVQATDEVVTALGGNGGQVRRAPDGRMYAAAQGTATLRVIDMPDVATPTVSVFALDANARSTYGLPQTATGCALPALSCAVPTDFTGYTRVDGTAGTDIIDKTGQAGPFVIFGGGGQDLITGGTGNDIIFGGDGNDRLSGGPGDDRIFGDAGNDNLLGGGGNDALCGNDGNDSLEGGDGNDHLEGGNGFDRMYGQGGNDRSIGGLLNDFLDGGAGDNVNLDSEGSNVCINPSPCGPSPGVIP